MFLTWSKTFLFAPVMVLLSKLAQPRLSFALISVLYIFIFSPINGSSLPRQRAKITPDQTLLSNPTTGRLEYQVFHGSRIAVKPDNESNLLNVKFTMGRTSLSKSSSPLIKLHTQTMGRQPQDSESIRVLTYIVYLLRHSICLSLSKVQASSL